jgi:hypothetical protein
MNILRANNKKKKKVTYFISKFGDGSNKSWTDRAPEHSSATVFLCRALVFSKALKTISS